MSTYSNMPDPVLESQLSTVLTAPVDAVRPHPCNVLAGPEMLTRRSAVFVDLFDTARYGTRSVPSCVRFFTWYSTDELMLSFVDCGSEPSLHFVWLELENKCHILQETEK